MAKKAVKKQTPTPVRKSTGVSAKSGNRKEALQSDVKILENALEATKPNTNANTTTNTASSTELPKTTNGAGDDSTGTPATTNGENQSISNDGVQSVSTTGTDTPIDEKKPLSIWDDVKKPTEEDALIGTQKPAENETANSQVNVSEDTTSAAASAANNMASQANGSEFDFTEDEARKQSYKVKASMVVELLDVVFMIICTVITWDFTDENQKRFTLHKDRKKAIQFNLYQMYELEGKKVEPKKALWGLILGSYAPMLVVAVLMFFGNMKRRKEEQELKKKKAALEAEQSVKLTESEAREIALRKDRERMQEEIDQLKGLRDGEKKPRVFKGAETVKAATKSEKARHFYVHDEKTVKKRGVQPGTKRGSYNKNK